MHPDKGESQNAQAWPVSSRERILFETALSFDYNNILNDMRKIIILQLIVLFSFLSNGQSNLFVPPLPEMSYVSVTDKSKFLGDRWSYMESGKSNSPVIIALHGYGGEFC